MRRLRPRGTDWFSLFVVAVAGASAVLVIGSGHPEASAAVFATYLGFEALVAVRRRSVRRRQRSSGARVRHLREARKLAHPAAQIWQLIRPAENEPLFTPSTARGYTVPGTPDGLGEQQAFEHLDGTTTVFEVVEYVEGTRAVTVQVSPEPEPDQRFRMFTEVEQHDDGCLLTVGFDYTLEISRTLRQEWEASTRRWLNDYLDRVERAADARRFPRPV